MADDESSEGWMAKVWVPLCAVILGGFLATFRSVLTTHMVIEANEGTRDTQLVADRIPRQGERRLEAYDAVAIELAQATIDVVAWQDATDRGDDARLNALRPTMIKHGTALPDALAE